MERVGAGRPAARETIAALRLLLEELEGPAGDVDLPYLLRRLAAILNDAPPACLVDADDVSGQSRDADSGLAVYADLLRQIQSALRQCELDLRSERERILGERAAVEKAVHWSAAQMLSR